jgi:DNA polymerase-3 subunit gamma/tau
VGQEATAVALANAINMGREAHALIFTGVRGVGKTTVARLYAKSLNCEQLLPESEPCNQCESCKAITLGCHEDVIEIDGASNTGVADVRALQETIEYVPQRSKYKVYIIDEVHMLSQAAFNALLKTLEEPPSHVVFVFATTELHKVPQTILSRCQAFYLKKLPTALILKRLSEIFGKEGITFDEKALAIIAREGHGSMRDALTLADQAIALGQGKVTAEVLGGIISNLSSSPYLELLQALVDRNFERVAATISELDQSGVEFVKLAEEVAGFARHAFIVQGIGIKAVDTAILGLDDIEIARLEQIAKSAQSFDLNRIFRTLVKCREELDGSALDRFVVENYFFEWCFDPGLPKVEDLMAGGTLAAGSLRKDQTSAASTQAQAQAHQPTTPRMNPGSMRELIADMRKQQAPGTHPQKKTEDAPVAPAAVRPAPVTAAPPSQPAPPAPTPAAAAPVKELKGATVRDDVSRFPSTWRQLIDTWKREKPLQARKLEEVHPLNYSPEKIVLAVPEEGLAGRQLLQKDEQVRITALFRELFDFKGTLTFISRSQALAQEDLQPPPPVEVAAVEATVNPSAAPLNPKAAPVILNEGEGSPQSSDPESLLPETVRSEKMREAELARQQKIQESKDAPITRHLAAALNATIETVRLPGD